MAISVTNLLKEVNTANTNPYTTTGTPTLHAGNLGLLAVMSQKTGGAVSPTGISGPGTTTWVEVTHVDFDTIATPLRRLTLYRACNAADQTGAITVTFAGSQSNCFIVLDEASGTAATSANNGSDGINTNIVTNRNDSATASPFTVTLAALASASNAGFVVMGSYAQTQSYVAGSGLTGLGDALGSSTGSDSGDIFSEYGINKTSMTATYTTAQGNAGIAVEILAAGAGGISGSGAVTIALGVSGSGLAGFIGSGAVALGLSVTGSGGETFSGSGGAAIALGVSGAGTILVPISGSGAITLSLQASSSGQSVSSKKGGGGPPPGRFNEAAYRELLAREGSGEARIRLLVKGRGDIYTHPRLYRKFGVGAVALAIAVSGRGRIYSVEEMRAIRQKNREEEADLLPAMFGALLSALEER